MPNPAALLSERKLNFHFKSLLFCFFSTCSQICIMKIPCMELYSDSPTWVRVRENPNSSGLCTSLWILPQPAGFCSAWNAISPQPRLALGPAGGKCSVELDWTALRLPVRAGRSPSPTLCWDCTYSIYMDSNNHHVNILWWWCWWWWWWW